MALGWHVVAVEPSDAMRAELTARPCRPSRPARAPPRRMDLPDACVDAVTIAQAWHWVDPPAASAEIARVLRPGGQLAVIWNVRDQAVDWVARWTDIVHRGDSLGVTLDYGEPAARRPLHRAGARRRSAGQHRAARHATCARWPRAGATSSCCRPTSATRCSTRSTSSSPPTPTCAGATSSTCPYAHRVLPGAAPLTLGRLPSSEPPLLRRQVRARPSLAAALGDDPLERGERPGDRRLVRQPAAALALVEPLDDPTVPALGVAAPAGGHLVLQPRRSALDPRDEVLARRREERSERPAAPHAARAVSLDGEPQALRASRLVRRIRPHPVDGTSGSAGVRPTAPGPPGARRATSRRPRRRRRSRRR